MASEKTKQEYLYGKVYGSYIDVKSTENTVSNYTKLAEEYEVDFVGLGYDTPKVIATEALKYLPDDDDKCTIMDIACGTGLVAQGLRSNGFRGKIDGIDGSKGMLKLAEKKGIYRNLYEQFILPTNSIPTTDNSYDVVVCCGGFGPGHLLPQVLGELIRITKPEGVLVFATRYNKAAGAYVTQLNLEIERLVDAELWKQEKVFLSQYFSYDASASEGDEKHPLMASIYSFKKYVNKVM